MEAPSIMPLFRSASTPDGQANAFVKQAQVAPRRLPRSLSAEALFRPHAMDTKETHGLVQELAYHTNSSYKQLQELCERLKCFEDDCAEGGSNQFPLIEASAHSSPVQSNIALELPDEALLSRQTSNLSEKSEARDDSDVALAVVLADFGLSTRPDTLRVQLKERLRPKVRRHGSRHLTPKSSVEFAPDLSRANSSASTPASGLQSLIRGHARKSAMSEDWDGAAKILNSQSGRPESGINSRMAVRLQISRFLQEPRNRVRVLSQWKNEAASLPTVQQLGNWLHVANRSDLTLKRYRTLYEAFEAMFSNLLDENDSPIRKVLFDLMSREAKRSAWVCPRDDRKAMPPQAEGTRRAVQCFRDAVLKVRSSPLDDALLSERFEKNQWDDCLSRLNSQFEQAFEETFRRAWPQAEMAFGVIPDEEGKPVVSPFESLKRTLVQNVDNADLFCAASKSIASSADAFERDSSQTPEQWNTYLRQAITVSKNFLELARELTLLTGLWTMGHGDESEHLSNTVLRQEYKRVCRGFANLLLQRQREILENWSERISKELLHDDEKLAIHMASKEGRRLREKILGAVVDWWRTQKSGMLRYACIDVVAVHMEKIDVKPSSPASGSGSSGRDMASTQLEQILAVMLLFKDVALEVLRREVAVRDGFLSVVDEPRVLDIMSRLMHELREHLISEWHITLAERHGDDVLPPSRLFQAPGWRRGHFDRDRAKTAFLGTTIQNRYVVTRYIHRGSMGRVWQVEENGSKMEPFPLCLKTFYTEDECLDMSNLFPKQYATCVLAELSQVERWLTSSTRLAHSRHLVRVVKVFRKEPVVNERQGCPDGEGRVEGHINGILMEYCENGELTSFLMDSKTETCKPFDEPTAQFLFKQLADLLIELFAPSSFGNSFDSTDSISNGTPSNSTDRLNDWVHLQNNLISPQLPMAIPMANAMPQTQWVSTVTSAFAEFTEEDGAESPKSPKKISSSPPRIPSLLAPPLMREKTTPLKYFHDDIKTENLVLSGTTLKLIDFQSLKPLRSAMSTSEIKHATIEYSHRQEQALQTLGNTIETQAEGIAVWACGVILVSLLAPELDAPSWVYQNRGLGSQKELEKRLEEDHCLLQQRDGRGVRDLLEKIFSKDRTPSIDEVWNHPWVVQARELYSDKSAIEEIARKLLWRAPEASDPQSAYVAWVPLRHCVLQAEKPAPFEYINEIVETAISFSGKPYPKFCLEKHRVTPDDQAPPEHREGEEEDPDAEEYEFHEWSISMVIDEENEGSGNEAEEDASTLPSLAEDPQIEESPPFHSRKDKRNLSIASSGSMGAPRRRKSLWKLMRVRMTSDRFVVQVRPRKDNPTEEDPTGIWWLRVKWLPPMVGQTKSEPAGSLSSQSSLSSLTTRRSFSRNMQQGASRFVQSSNFMQLQHLLLEGLNEVQQRRELEEQERLEQRRLEERRRAQGSRGKSVGIMLPIGAFGR